MGKQLRNLCGRQFTEIVTYFHTGLPKFYKILSTTMQLEMELKKEKKCSTLIVTALVDVVTI